MAMLKGSMKAVVIYRREWSKSSDGGVANLPFCDGDETFRKDREDTDVHVNSPPVLC